MAGADGQAACFEGAECFVDLPGGECAGCEAFGELAGGVGAVGAECGVDAVAEYGGFGCVHAAMMPRRSQRPARRAWGRDEAPVLEVRGGGRLPSWRGSCRVRLHPLYRALPCRPEALYHPLYRGRGPPLLPGVE